MYIPKDLVAASATPLVLGILAEDESYGYAILKQVSDLSGGRMEWTDGLLYPLLHRLERLGHIESTWRTPPSGRPRKYYRITDQGRAELAEQRRQWSAVVDTLKRDMANRRAGYDSQREEIRDRIKSRVPGLPPVPSFPKDEPPMTPGLTPGVRGRVR